MMNKRIIIILILYFIFLSFFYKVNAEENYDEILKSQYDSIGISSFIDEANKYKDDDFEIDISNAISSAIKGNVDNKSIGNKILSIFFGEIKNSITIIGSIIVVILISSVFKSISESLENEGVAQVTYYVTYILIVTIIMKNFSDSIEMVKTSISNLVGFSNSLIPLLISLMLSTRQYCICKYVTTNNTYDYNLYWKLYKYDNNSYKLNICSYKYNFRSI